MPLATDYVSAVQTPSVCFADGELASGQPAMNVLGLPLTYPGAFATVYKMECPGDQAWAVKCFTRHVPDLQERYAAISAHLEKNRRRFAVEFRYLEQGIRIKGVWHPILKMRWVAGFTLNEFLHDRACNPTLLEEGLCPLWLRLGDELRASKTAHGDLQHGNVLLVPGASSIALRLIDYDGTWVPDLEGKPPGEVGHPNFQHPQRLRQGGYNAEIDRFAHLAIYVAFRCLAVGGQALWDKHDNGENLLFKESDFRDPAASKLWPELFSLPDSEVVTLAAHLLAASQMPLDRVPLTADLIAGAKVAPLSGEQRDVIRDRAPALKPPRPPVPPPPPPRPSATASPEALLVAELRRITADTTASPRAILRAVRDLVLRERALIDRLVAGDGPPPLPEAIPLTTPRPRFSVRLARAFSVPKRGKSAQERQDAHALDAETGRFAVADGADGHLQSGAWAAILTQGFVQGGSQPWQQWLAPLQRGWANLLSIGETPWFAGQDRGAYSTVLGVWIDGEHARAVAVGDSCLFHVRDNRLRSSFPRASASEFTSIPAWLIGSRDAPADLHQPENFAGTLRPGDQLLLMTSSLACWFLASAERGEQPWTPLEAFARLGDQGFAAWVDRLRDRREVKDDDTTVVVVYL